MAFSPSLPADDAKIRDFPQQMRDNFTAIDTGDTSFAPDKLNLSVQGGDPTLLNNSIILYSKDSSSESALYAKNDANDTLQLTDQEYLGGASQKIKAASIRFGSGTVDNTQTAMCTAWGIFTSGGATTAAYNCSAATNGGTGLYRITFGTTLSNANYAVVCTSQKAVADDNCRVINVVNSSKTTTRFDIEIRRASDGVVQNQAFSIMVFGGL